MKFNEKLVLNSYLLSLFGVKNFEDKNLLFQADHKDSYIGKILK